MLKIFKRKCKYAVLRFCGREGKLSVLDGSASRAAELSVREYLEHLGHSLGLFEGKRKYIGIAAGNCPAGSDQALDECRILTLLKVLGQYCRELDYRTGEISDGVCSCTNVVRGDVHFLSEVITRQGEHIEIVRLAIKEEEMARFYLYGKRNPTKELSAKSNCAEIIARLAAAGMRVRILCEAMATCRNARKNALRRLAEMGHSDGVNIDELKRQILNSGKLGCDYAASFEVCEVS